MAKSRLYIANHISKSFSISPGQTDPTCWCNIIQHCWIQHVALVWPPCCTMMHDVGSDVERSLISIKHRLQHHPAFLVFLSVKENVAFVWPPCSTLLNASMSAKYLFPWQWFTASYVPRRCYGMVNEKSFQSLRRKYKRSLRKLKKKGQSSRWKPENCEIRYGNKFLLLRGIVVLLLIFRLQLYC